MAEEKTMRLSLVAKQINMGTSTILQFLSAKGHKVDNNPNAKLNYEQLSLLAAEYGANHLLATEEAPKKIVEELVVPAPVVEEKKPEPVAVVEVAPEPVKEVAPEVPVVKEETPAPVAEKQVGLKVLGKIDLDKNAGLADQEKVAALPVTRIYSKGKLVIEKQGFLSDDELRKLFEQAKKS